MTVSLVYGPAILALEFDPDDQERVETTMRNLFSGATLDVEQESFHVSGEDLPFVSNGDDRCVISGTDEGKAILQAIAAKMHQVVYKPGFGYWTRRR